MTLYAEWFYLSNAAIKSVSGKKRVTWCEAVDMLFIFRGTIETVTDIHDFSMEVKPANKPTLALPHEKQKPRVRVSSKDGKTIT